MINVLRTTSLLLPAALVAVACFVFASVPSNRQWAGGDLPDYFLPVSEWLGGELSAGRIPFWNPMVGCGLDQFCTFQSGVCYPPQWINAVLPAATSLCLLTIFHLIVASTGAFLWLSAKTATHRGALVGAIVFLSGIVGEAWWPPMLFTVSWVPWILYGVDAKSLPIRTRFLLCTIAIVLEILAGFPQQVLYCTIFVVGYAIVSCVQERENSRSVVLGLALVTAGLVACVQLVPSLGYSKSTWRPGKLSPEQVHYLEEFKEHVSYTQDLKVLSSSAVRLLGYDPKGDPQSLSYAHTIGYFGFLAPVLIGVALLTGWGALRMYLIGVALTAALLSQGYATVLPLYDVFATVVPMFGSFRSPSRILIWLVLVVAILAAEGASRISLRDITKHELLAITIFIACTLVINTMRHSNILFVHLSLATVFAMSYVLIRAAKLSNLNHQWAVSSLLAILLVLNWGASMPYLMRFFDYDHTALKLSTGQVLASHALREVNRQIGHERLYVSGDYKSATGFASGHNFRGLVFYEPAVPASHFSINSMFMYPGKAPQPSYHNIDPRSHPALFDVFAVKMVLTPSEIEDAKQHGWTSRGSIGEFSLYENDKWMSRASLFYDFQIRTDEQSRKDLTESVSSRSILSLPREPSVAWQELRGKGGWKDTGKVEWLRDIPGHVSLSIDSDSPALLRLAETCLPGWTCRVNGTNRVILMSNGVFQTVELFPGQNIVEFSYIPQGLGFGLAISVAGCALALAIWGILGRHRFTEMPSTSSFDQ